MVLAANAGAGLPALKTGDVIQLLNEQHTKVMAEYQKQDTQLRGLRAEMTEVQQSLVRRGGLLDRLGGGSPIDTLGAKVVASEGYKHFAETMRCVGKVKIQVENAITSAADSGGALSPADTSRRMEPIALPRMRLTVRNLLGKGTTNQNMVEYTKQTGRTNNAAVVSEGALKPESSIHFELAEAPVRTIATWIPASKQIMDDAPRLQQFLDTELRFMIAMEEEVQFLFGDGNAPNIQGCPSKLRPTIRRSLSKISRCSTCCCWRSRRHSRARFRALGLSLTTWIG
jgi:HK97 family phage major capsid protein